MTSPIIGAALTVAEWAVYQKKSSARPCWTMTGHVNDLEPHERGCITSGSRI